MSATIGIITEKVKKETAIIEAIRLQTSKVLVAQDVLVDRLMIGLLTNGHILIEGVPGLAKTTAVRTVASTIQAKFQRIQFTPDMLPADITGTMIYDQNVGQFKVKKGPIFANIILADEINRAPAKVQSALLEAMQEKQVTIGEETFHLPAPFIVLATQNPIEQEGTYPLPEAQVDRFMLKVRMDYPNEQQELVILRRMAKTEVKADVMAVTSPEDILRLRAIVDEIYMDEKIEQYIVRIIEATRRPAEAGLPKLKGLIQYGASPRATINLALASRAHAFLRGRGYVTPQDIKSIAFDVLRHRIVPSYEAEAEGKVSEDLIKDILDYVPVP